MDRIDKFLGTRPSKKKRLVRVNGRVIEITKEDVKKARRYVNRECLDTIDLHAPFSTRYSGVPGEAALPRPKTDASLFQQRDQIKKLRAAPRRAPAAPKAQKAPWTSHECGGGDELVNAEPYDQQKRVCDYVFGLEDLDAYVQSLEQRYARRPERPRRVAVDRFEIRTRFPRREAKAFAFGASGAVHGGRCLAEAGDGGRVVVDVKRGLAVGAVGGPAVLCAGGVFAVERGRVVRRDAFGRAERGVCACPAPATGIAARGDCVAVTTGDGVAVTDAGTGKTTRLRMAGAQKAVVGEGAVFVLARTCVYGVDLRSLRRAVVATGAQDVAAGGAVVIAAGEDVVVGGRRLHQGGVVRAVAVHPALPLFCAVTGGELRVFCFEAGDGAVRVRLCSRVPGRFSAPAFHATRPWLFAHCGGRLRLVV